MKNEIKKADDVQVIKKKPRGGNSPVIGNNGLMTEPGDNARYMNINIELMRLRDIDLTDVEQVEEVRDRLGIAYAGSARHNKGRQILSVLAP